MKYILTTIAAITMMTTFVTIDAYATHPLPTYNPWNSDDNNQYIWYDIYSLNFVTMDGSEDSGDGWRLIGEVSRASVHYNSDLNILEREYVFGDNVFDATYYSSTGVYGATQAYDSGANLYKFIYMNTNNGVNYRNNATCIGTDAPNPQYISNHEFGHLAGLGHSSSIASDSHTAMKGGCNPGQASIKSADFNQINGFYDP